MNETIYDTARLEVLAERAGSHFFDASAKRFFNSRIHEQVYGNRYFVTSEQDSGSYDGRYPAQPRLYTVREFQFYENEDGRTRVAISTVGAFQGYASRSVAHRVARELGASCFGRDFPTSRGAILANTTGAALEDA